MAVHNAEIASMFYRLADLLDIEGVNQFRVRAYRNGARTIEDYPRSMVDMVEAGDDLTELHGIGEELAQKIQTIVQTGRLPQLEEAARRTPPELLDMLRVEGLGPKRVRTIYKELGVTSLDELKRVAADGRIRKLPGLGRRLEEKILEDLTRRPQEERRTRLDVAERVVQSLIAYLTRIEGLECLEAAGSYRRRRETVGDLDILAISESGEDVIQSFVAHEDVDEVVSQGKTRSTVVLRSGLQVDLRVVPQESYGAALLYFTGSKPHNIVVRDLALDKGLKINEYGVFRGEERIAGQTEEQIYALFDMPLIEPELREDRGEIKAAQSHRLPQLVRLEDIRGDLQVHTTASDGRASLREIARAAQDRGYDYLAITDHSPYIAVTRGVDAEALAQEIVEIQRLNEKMATLRLLMSVEVDILEDGSLDLPDDILKRLDLTVGAIHSRFGLSRQKQTERIVRAMDNPYFNILAHPTGRRIGKRDPYDVDIEQVMEAALERGCFLEVNAHPERSDLNDVHAKLAKDMGLKVAISSDAHSVNELALMRFGVYQARRGWLEADDVINTRSWAELRKLLDR